MMREMIEEIIIQFIDKYDLGDIEITELSNSLVDAIEGYFEYKSYSVAPASDSSEIDMLRRALEFEKSKIICSRCDGSGEDISYGPSHVASSRCPECRGAGKVLP